jgi:hypothetical protein
MELRRRELRNGHARRLPVHGEPLPEVGIGQLTIGIGDLRRIDSLHLRPSRTRALEHEHGATELIRISIELCLRSPHDEQVIAQREGLTKPDPCSGVIRRDGLLKSPSVSAARKHIRDVARVSDPIGHAQNQRIPSQCKRPRPGIGGSGSHELLMFPAVRRTHEHICARGGVDRNRIPIQGHGILPAPLVSVVAEDV